MARLWRNKPETREGKYLVTRRDGTVPAWPNFVIGARDPAAPAALKAYADEAERLNYDPDYIADLRSLAVEFEAYCLANGQGDPDASPHRKDDPETIAKMQLGRGS